MKMLFLIVLTLTVCLRFSALCQEVPKGWRKAGNYPEGYKIAVDKEIKYKGRKSGFLYSVSEGEDELYFGTIIQDFLIDTNWMGKKIKMNAYIKTKEVSGWSGAWMRIDGKDERSKNLQIDSMTDRPIKGTTDWKEYNIILDIPKESWKVAFGVLLSGSGQVWIDDVHFEIINSDNTFKKIKKLSLLNLDFED